MDRKMVSRGREGMGIRSRYGGGVDVQVRVIRYDSTVGLVFFIFIGMEKLKGKGTERPGKDNRKK